MTDPSTPADDFTREVRLHVFRLAADTARVPQPPEIAAALNRPQAEVERALRQLAAGRVVILAPNGGDIWAASPFCAVPSPFGVATRGKTYWAMCIWDALGIAAALGADAVIRTACGDCGEPMRLAVTDGELTKGEGVVHFGVPASRWWDNIGFT